MKKTRKSCAIFPLDSAMSNCVSKYARRTYGLQLNLGRNTWRTLRLICLVSRNGLSLFYPLWFSVSAYGVTTGEFPCGGSPLASRSFRYESTLHAIAVVTIVKYWCCASEISILTTIRIGLLMHIATLSWIDTSGREYTIKREELMNTSIFWLVKSNFF